jgi:hypothetical protein
MNFTTKLKFFTSGCAAAGLLKLYLLSLEEKETQYKHYEINKHKLLNGEELENLKHFNNKIEKDVVFSFLYHTYLEYLIGMGMVFFKFINQENKTNLIKNYFYKNILQRSEKVNVIEQIVEEKVNI